MRYYVDVDYESLYKYNEELCGDKVEVVQNEDSVIIVLADGLGSGVKANILATLTSKIIATMLVNHSEISEAVETISSTLPVCHERGIAYSTFSILQIFNTGDVYLVEFDNPGIMWLRKGKPMKLKKVEREVSGKKISESRFRVEADDVLIMISDGVVHAGIGNTINLGWQRENVLEYASNIYKQDTSSKKLSKLLLSACNSLYAGKPGDDSTIASIKIKNPLNVNIMIGPPIDTEKDKLVVKRFMEQDGKKVVCGGTTAQIVSRETGEKIETSFNYFNLKIPPTAKIKGIDLTTEGVITFKKAVTFAEKYASKDCSMQDLLELSREDGASKLARLLLEESTSVHFFVGSAMNPAHQNTGFPYNLDMKIKLVENMIALLKALKKEVVVEYY
jgi:hypothetical protein